ncbi:MAG TPA: AAA domain-containing protein, partial [Isosphaeraceae bacterium]|nr:AAA domain-containing protein [Isosphaeraceae bacterium]
AIRAEIAAVSKEERSAWLDIDAIEHLADQPGHFVYRLVLSSPIQIAPDQAVTFQTQRPQDKIPAVVIKADDEGLVVECQKALPTDARLLSMSFDPAFILRALGEFIEDVSERPGPIARQVYSKNLPSRPQVTSSPIDDLNDDQSEAVAEMREVPLYLLWGPPGTGKTTTMGTAIAGWMRDGKKVLVVSTSNAAVDVAMRSVLKRVHLKERKHLLRLGTSLDPEVGTLTLEGKLAERDRDLAERLTKTQRRITEINEIIASKTATLNQLHAYFNERAECEGIITQFNDLAEQESAKLLAEVRVTGCTLARMVLDKGFRQRQFDVVVLDEASMASLLYALGASFLAKSQIVYAGDPKQLPPIVQADTLEARRWFGRNIYGWFGVEREGSEAATRLKLLGTQYRMTDEIGGLVSRLTYNNQLRHGRGRRGPVVEFVELPEEWQTTHYSVAESSYYHLAAVPALHALKDVICEDGELLLLSPFRPQRSLLSALAYDLKEDFQDCKITASTIHRSQGSESRTVVVDLTTHRPGKGVPFFADEHCQKLINVALSRAKDLLLVLGSRAMLESLGVEYPFWRTFLGEFGRGVSPLPCSELLGDFEGIEDLTQFPGDGEKELPAIYSHTDGCGPIRAGADLLSRVEASRKLLVSDKPVSVGAGDLIVRQGKDLPEVFMAGGRLCLRFDGGWLVLRSPNVTRVVWRIAFSHLADEALNPIQAKRFFCPACPDGTLLLKSVQFGGLVLACTGSQAQYCNYSKKFSLADARVLVRMYDVRCSQGHPMTARSGPKGKPFIGCENYPHCQETKSFTLYAGC